MKGRWVLDASAAIHLVLRTPKAPELLGQLEQATLVIAPSLYCSETANALWKYVKVGQLTAEQAATRHEEALHLVDRFIPDCELGVEALALAAQQTHPVYDAMYAVLARRHVCSVATQDRRLATLLEKIGVTVFL